MFQALALVLKTLVNPAYSIVITMCGRMRASTDLMSMCKMRQYLDCIAAISDTYLFRKRVFSAEAFLAQCSSYLGSLPTFTSSVSMAADYLIAFGLEMCFA